MTSPATIMLHPPKLNFDNPGPIRRGGPLSTDLLATLARDLHAPDGIVFIADVLETISQAQLPDRNWVGVINGDVGDVEALSRQLSMCRGLWVTSESERQPVAAAGFPCLVAKFPDSEEQGESERVASAVANSAVYRALPTPRSQAAELFRGFDLTVVLCSYKRVRNIAPILEAFCNQTYSGTFEVIVWNNNPDASAELEAAVEPYRSRLDLTLLHSSRNYYCIVRLAMAQLMRGEHLMICDDDVKPGTRYLDTFVSALHEAGDRAVICAKGNTFRPHTLNPESPHRVWENWEHLDFWDERAAPREIHFMHGSNCLVPKTAIQQLSGIDLPNREYILVDDYWLSYALSALLGWKLWKIEASGAFNFDESASDPEVALWLNPRVQQERTNFYVYHMRHGWPEGCSG